MTRLRVRQETVLNKRYWLLHTSYLQSRSRPLRRQTEKVSVDATLVTKLLILIQQYKSECRKNQIAKSTQKNTRFSVNLLAYVTDILFHRVKQYRTTENSLRISFHWKRN